MKQSIVLFIGALIVTIQLTGMLQQERGPISSNTPLNRIRRTIQEMTGVKGVEDLLKMYKELEKQYKKNPERYNSDCKKTN